MTAGSRLRIPIGPGLAFAFDLPEVLLRRIEDFLAYFVGRASAGDSSSAVPAVRVTSQPPPDGAPAGTTLLEEPPLIVRRAGELTLFELPRIRAWCDGARGRAGVVVDRPSDGELDLFVGLALAPMLLELAPSRGWLGVHAAGVAIEDTGILLPGPSGAGKSTIFTHAHCAGLGVLSDDLVWLRPAVDGATMYAFPRGAPGSVPGPTVDAVALRAIVCPLISGEVGNRLLPLALPQALAILIEQGGFLTSGPPAGDRFRALVRLAQAVPGYRLEAGRHRREVPAALTRLAASLASQERPRPSSKALRSTSIARPPGSPRQRCDSR